MFNPNVTAQIFSVIGNSSSLVPLGLKDVSNSLGMTAGSYVTGNKLEGKDRFIDEFGTLFIWLLGVPFYKKIIDKTIYKWAGYNPNIDTRILKDKDVFEKAKKHALPGLKESFEKVEKNQKLFKGMFLARFAVATVLTLISYDLLTSVRHKHTEKSIIKEIKKEEAIKKANEQFLGEKTAPAFKSFNKKQNPSFGMNLAPLQQFMFDPVKNTMLIDVGITSERFIDARNPQDFMGYVIKEGGFWAFMYFAGKIIQENIEKNSAKKGKPIDLDIRVLQDKNFQTAFADKSIEKHLAEFSTQGTDAEVYDSLFKKSDNLVVQMAKKADIIHTQDEDDLLGRVLKSLGLKEHDNAMHSIDSQKYIDISEIKGTEKTSGFKKKIENLYEAMKKSGKTPEEFFKEITSLKRKSVIKNMGACIGVLGILIPGIMVAMRFMGAEENKEFQTKKEIHEKLKKENNLL